MTYGLQFRWVSGGLPYGGDCYLFDDRGDIVCLLDRDAFVEDPDGFMESLERHQHVNTAGHGPALALLPSAVGDGRSPVPSRAARARTLSAIAVLPLTGCAWIAATFAQGMAPVVGG